MTKKITIFGGSGFLGRSIVEILSSLDTEICIASRQTQHNTAYKNVSFHYCDYNDESQISSIIDGSNAVINLVGILFERGENSFKKIHTDLPQKIAQICREKNIEQLVHVSALGVDKSLSKYGKSKLAGESALLTEYPKAVILRPSIIFGADDNFFNMFAKIAKILPILPLIGGGRAKFQPVYVKDVAQAVCNILVGQERNNFSGKIFELGGPDIESFKELFERLGKEMGCSLVLMPLPFPIAYIQAAFMGLMPKPMLTIDQVRSLKTDNVVSSNALTMSDLGIRPTSMDKVLPSYLACYKQKK